MSAAFGLDSTGDQPAIWSLVLNAVATGQPDLAGYLFYDLSMYGEADRLQVAYLWGGDQLRGRLVALMDELEPLVSPI